VAPRKGAPAPQKEKGMDRLINLIVTVLTRLGLLKEDLDYHLIRASMVIIFLFLKDVVLFAASFYLLKQDVVRVSVDARRREMRTWRQPKLT
jgi:hypothetical protein